MKFLVGEIGWNICYSYSVFMKLLWKLEVKVGYRFFGMMKY